MTALRYKSEPPTEAGYSETDVENLICPVCGYYCLGKGGIGCIDKAGLFAGPIRRPEEER